MPSFWLRRLVLTATLACVLSGGARAADCETGSFDGWLDSFKREAVTKGIAQQAVDAGLAGVTSDPKVLARDRAQGVFQQTFEEFSGRMVPPRIQRARSLMQQHAATLQKVEEQFGVPGPLLVAIWGLETDFGSNVGKFSTIRSIATLAYDCRRSPMFRAELFDALRIVQRGDLAPAEMRGAWAGEIGQTQFMPSSYVKYAIDFDGNGHSDLIHSVPDVMASTANFLKGTGWQKGQGWDSGTPNFGVIQQWNKSDIYSRTIAYFGQRLAGQAY